MMDSDIIKNNNPNNNTEDTFTYDDLFNYKEDYNLIEKSGYFNETYYRKHNPNIKDEEDAIDYFLENGNSEDYPTSKYFNPGWYLKANADVAKSKINPLIHFLRFGITEHRLYRYAKTDVDNLFGISCKDRVKLYYETIYDSTDFDIDYYINRNNITSLNNLDPIIHYILYGADLGYNPSRTFNTGEYTRNTFKKVTTNPLYHYIKYHSSKSAFDYMKDKHIPVNAFSKYNLTQTKRILNQLKKKVSIIIPIYNAYEETRECIQSVLLNTHIDYELILINDCSTDTRINELLELVEPVDFVRVIQNKENQGFVKNVNIGIKASKNDVVLLNSDTIVTPKWLSQLVFSAYSANKIATVTPVSNSSDISIKKLSTQKDRPFLNEGAYQVNKLNDNTFLESPTGNGFCLYIKRDVIDDIGLFDEIFGKGYGEETDFTSRALEHGWINIRNPSVFIYHRRHASFSSEKSKELKEKNKQILKKRHPHVYDEWNKFVTSTRFKNTINNLEENIVDYKKVQRVLYITTYDRDNNLELDDNFYSLCEKYECYILSLTPDKISIKLYDNIKNIIDINEWTVSGANDKDFYINLYFNMFINYKIDLVYIKNFVTFHHPYTMNLSLFVKFFKSLEINVLNEGTFYDDNEICDVSEELLNPDKSLDELIREKANYINFDNKKVVVYTALTGHYDNLVTPLVVEDDFDYICFTDNPDLKSNFWQIRYMENLDLDEVRKARRYKILPHKYLQEYDYSIWIDTNFDIIGSLKDYINKYSKNHKLLAVKHEKRDCIYEEARVCLSSVKDSPEIINSQMDKYAEENYPGHNGLVASGILFRNHHDSDVIKLMNDWYNEVINYSRRDQLSFNYVCWKNNFNYDESNIFYFKNKYFQRLIHTSIKSTQLQYTQKQMQTILDAMEDKTTIIIPIYNAYEETKECIESVQKYTDIPYELLLINDCSTDKRIDTLLSSLSDTDNIKVINNQVNRGFVGNINLGFKESCSDVVLLNSDTVVTPKWLEKLRTAAYSDNKIATVTPVSNNAGAFSVPVLNQENIISDELGINGTANIVEKVSDNRLIDTPTGNGFCMFVKREAICEVGYFDLGFGRGYGEENDFCMRLVDAGWKNVIDTSTYIFHNRSVSFGSEKEKLIEENRNYLNTKHPSYKGRVVRFINSQDYKLVRKNIDLYLNSENNQEFNRKRILYVIHKGKGGTLYTSIDLMKHIYESMDVYIVTAGRTHIKLYKYSSFETSDRIDDEFSSHLQIMGSWKFKTGYSIKNPRIPEFSRLYFNIIKMLHIDIIHIRHLIRHSFDIPYIARLLGIPVIISFHDFYYVCPSHNLIDDTKNYCGGHCTPLTENTTQCNVTRGLNVPTAKKFIGIWRKYVHDMFKCCDAFVTTARSAYDIYTEFYPELKERSFSIIEHGRDLKTPSAVNVPEINSDEPVRIVIPGNISTSKGAAYINELKKYDKDNRIELHFLGNVDRNYHFEKIGVVHGVYKRSEFCKLIHEINPNAIAILSIWPETYCHTLSESWSCGIPIISMDIGALGERIHKYGGGFLISDNPKEAYDDILSIFKDSDNYMKVANQIPDIKFKSTKKMSQEYMEIYKRFISDL